MRRRWTVANDCLEIAEMPFYWRLSESTDGVEGIAQRLPIRVTADPQFDYLKYEPSEGEWETINRAYQQDANIGFLNPQSGQLQTYGSSVNNFFLESVVRYAPERIYELGCGAGFSIEFLRSKGWSVTGVDPSEYSLNWSDQLGFPLINEYFSEGLLSEPADFIFCNDVFEHVREVESFSVLVFNALAEGGVFCFATTNSTHNVAVGDISMLEHQHVNMFTEKSMYLILEHAGFSDISVKSGGYGNTFHVTARKVANAQGNESGSIAQVSCEGFFERAEARLSAFENFYRSRDNRHFYVPLRCMSYLASVGDFGESHIYDSNTAWRGKYIDGYTRAIRSADDVVPDPGSTFFIGSLTFHSEIKAMLVEKGLSESAIVAITDL